MKTGILISRCGPNMVAIVDGMKSGEIRDSEVANVMTKPDRAATSFAGRDRALRYRLSSSR